MVTSVIAEDLPLTVATGEPQTPPGRLAVEELRNYLGKIFTNPLKLAERADTPMLVLGTPASNPLIRQMVEQGKTGSAQGQER